MWGVTPDTDTGTDPEPAPFLRENIDMQTAVFAILSILKE
jgi:hypothetical protein